MNKKNRTALAIAFCLLLVFSIILPEAAAGRRCQKYFPEVKVATWNVYIGTDVFAFLNGEITLEEAVADIVATNFPARAQAIARQFLCSPPKLIGFQEVWSVDINTPDFGLTLDYRAILKNVLEGLGYVEVAANELTNLTIPLGGPYYISVVDHDVIYAKEDVLVHSTDELDYVNTFKAPLPAPAPQDCSIFIESKRGLVSAEVEIDGISYRFVNTHLEVANLPAVYCPGPALADVPAQVLQAQELAKYLADETLPVILVGDTNALPDSAVSAIIRKAGFADMWPRSPHGRRSPGYTCCQRADLRNRRSILDERIDYIYVRNSNVKWPFTLAFPLFAEVIGDRRRDKTRRIPNPVPPPRYYRLWPSDHGGVKAKLLIPSLGVVFD